MDSDHSSLITIYAILTLQVCPIFTLVSFPRVLACPGMWVDSGSSGCHYESSHSLILPASGFELVLELVLMETEIVPGTFIFIVSAFSFFLITGLIIGLSLIVLHRYS